MSVRNTVILGMVTGSLLLSLSAEAANSLPAGAFVIAKRDIKGDGDRDANEARDQRGDDRRKADSRPSLRKNSADGKGYGYGYERRQRAPESGDAANDDSRRDDRRRNGNRP